MGKAPSKQKFDKAVLNEHLPKMKPEQMPDLVTSSKIKSNTGKACETHSQIKSECLTRLKLIEKGVYSTVKSKFKWKVAFYRIINNVPGRDPVQLKEFLEDTYRKHRPMIDKCKQAHAIHCSIANYLNYRQGFYGFYS